MWGRPRSTAFRGGAGGRTSEGPDSGCVAKVELRGFVDGVDMGCGRKRGSQYDAKAFGWSNEFTESTLTDIGRVMARMAVIRIQGLFFLKDMS